MTVDILDTTTTFFAQVEQQTSNNSKKRKRCDEHDLFASSSYALLEDVMEEQTISPLKKMRLSAIPTQFFATKDATCSMLLEQCNTASLFNCCLDVFNTQVLRVADFCSSSVLSLYQQQQDLFTVPEFKLLGNSANAGLVLSYLQGLIARKQDVAIVPLENANYQLLIFEKSTFKSSDNAMSQQQDNFLWDQSLTDTIGLLTGDEAFTLHAILVPKFTMVFDLDETLIRSRMPKDPQEQALAGEHEFFVQGLRLFTAVRPGTDRVLHWACKLFRVLIFTNGVYDYAKEICKILDPKQETILAGIDMQNDDSIRSVLKSREQMATAAHLPKSIGLKDLSKFDLDLYTTVALDDDVNVWVQKENLLPFLQVTQCKLPHEFFNRMRQETWNKIQHLCKQKNKNVASFSQENVL